MRVDTAESQSDGPPDPWLTTTIAWYVGTRIRENTVLLVPFTVAALIGAISSAVRLHLPYAVGTTRFPDEGGLHVTNLLLPSLEPSIDVRVQTVRGLTGDHLALLLVWQLLIALMLTVAMALVLWWWQGTESRAWRPPADRVGWLFSYVLLVQLATVGFYFLVQALAPTLGLWILLVIPVAVVVIVGVFLTPASIVIGGNKPPAAVRESVSAIDRPLWLTSFIVVIGYLWYLLSSIAMVSADPLGLALGTLVSVSLLGTA